MRLMLLALFACSPALSPVTDTGTVEADTDTDTDTAVQACVPDHDGRISWEELVADPELGIQATYTANQPGTVVDVDVVGELSGEAWSWDFSAVDPEVDQTWSVSITDPAGAWFAADFPTATYTLGLDADEELIGIYRVDEAQERLLLLGMASATPGEVLLRYPEPVVAFEYPLVEGKSWDSIDVEAVGTFEGDDYPSDWGVLGVVRLRHSYSFEVDRRGRVAVPLGEFDVLRVVLHQRLSAVNETYGTVVGTATQTSHFFMTECTGLVARVRSEQDVDDPDFDRATEYLRLGF